MDMRNSCVDSIAQFFVKLDKPYSHLKWPLCENLMSILIIAGVCVVSYMGGGEVDCSAKC